MKEYNRVDQYLHWLSQVLAKVNRTYVPAKDDDSHTNLYFDSIGGRILGRWIAVGTKKVIPGLNLHNQAIEIIDATYQVLESISGIGKSRSQLEEEVKRAMARQGLDPDGYSEPMHFEIPEYGFENEPIKQLDQDSLARWGNYRGMANQACSLLTGHLQINSEARIWPHHFDTGVYLEAENLGLGFGLAMHDEMVGAPYFYLSPNLRDNKSLKDGFPESAHWRVIDESNWKGSVLPLTILEDNPLESVRILDSYLTQNTHWMLEHL